MSIDTLAYSKTLEEAGLDRKAAEAHAEALTQHIVPHLLTKTDLDQAFGQPDTRLGQTNGRLDQAIERLESRIDQVTVRLENRMDLTIERAELG
ncbi:MAG TPA: hypothetical protein VHW66_22585 [Stellaceae bacterium]|jgi:hypothetical protein|nr:hypothetical protein [Stellaceae bacterium]